MNPYATLLKEGRKKNDEMSMDGLMDILKTKYGVKMTKQNYRRYENEKELPKRPDYIMLEKVFAILGLDSTLLPHINKPSTAGYSVEEKAILLEKIMRLQDKVDTLQEKLENLTGGKRQ